MSIFHLWRGKQWIGGERSTAESALEFVLKGMSFGDVANEQPADVQRKIHADLRSLFREHQSDGGVAMEAIAWLVSARRA